MTLEAGQKYISWTVLGTALTGLLVALGMYLLQDTRASISDLQKTTAASFALLQEKKLDRDQYYRDVLDIKDNMSEIKKIIIAQALRRK